MENQTAHISSRDRVQAQYNNARRNLLVMILLTLVNLVLPAVGSGTMLLFSATVPYLAVAFGVAFEDPVLLAIAVIIAAVILIVYFLCWLFSKKHFGWMIAALVFFALDTLSLVGFYLLAGDFSGILDLIIHILVLYRLIVGVRSGAQLRKLPDEEPSYEGAEESGFDQTAADSVPLRIAENDVKFRVLLETEYQGRHIRYRRVKRTNQLVVDGQIYREIEMLLETSHDLTAILGGHTITAGFDGRAYSYISVDGTTIARKMRIV